MNYRAFGRTGWQVSEVGYGMWGMGGWTGSNDDESLASLERAVDLGCTFFDTAWVYGQGHSERLLGQLLRARPNARVYCATKLPPKDLKWPTASGSPLAATYPAGHIREYAEKSLANIGVGTLDLLQFHTWLDAWAEDDEWQRAVAALKAEGLVRAVGISVHRWEPESCLRALRTGLIDSVQVVYNVFDQAPEDTLFPACRERGVAVIARVPFDEGSLTGTLTRETRFPEGDWRGTYFTPQHLDATLTRVERLSPLVPTGSTLPDLALRFILSCPDVSTVIPGMRKARHVDANLGASTRGPLDASLVDALRAHRWNRVPNQTA